MSASNIYYDAYAVAGHYANIMKNGIPNSSRSVLSPVCEDIARIYSLDILDYMKYYAIGDRKFFYLFTNKEKDVYKVITYEDCIFFVVPNASLFKELTNAQIFSGIADMMSFVLDMSSILRRGSYTEIFKANFAMYYFAVLAIAKCCEIDKSLKDELITTIDDAIGDIIDGKQVVAAAMLEVKADNNIAKYTRLFMEHGVLSYMTPDALEVIRRNMIQ